MQRCGYLFIAVATGLLAVPAAGQDVVPSEPWGYLYAVRSTQLHPLTQDQHRIGRLAENEIVLTSPRVSRRHAVIRKGEDGVELVDVGSSNGTHLDGVALRPRFPMKLTPGARVQVADETLLFHVSPEELWRDELDHRLLAAMVKLRKPLPRDQTRRAFGREEVVPAVTEARVNLETGEAAVEHSTPPEDGGFPEGGGAFVGHLDVQDGVLEMSLWTIAAAETMTSRRSSFSNLKHATLRISVDGGSPELGREGPWFPQGALNALFEVFPDDPEFSLRFAHSLAGQDRLLALRDAASSLRFRHRLEPGEGDLLLLAARSKCLWVEREIGEKGLSLQSEDRTRLSAALEEARDWLDAARRLGAAGETEKQAEDALSRAEERLARLGSVP